ncbi:MAG TPA: hypothetical protein VHB21_27385 [Minicystis sp.]|nr:hypothetical protein [Minicystis sp.]
MASRFDTFELTIHATPPRPRWLGLARPVRARVWAEVVINGTPASPDFASTEVLLALGKGGLFFPFTCACGDAGCAGSLRGVQIVHAAGETLWNDADAGRTFVFATDAFEREIAKLAAAVREARARWPDVATEVSEPWLAD